jgi:anti-sigma regulatory factor (Ser/Thr protein kinase)
VARRILLRAPKDTFEVYSPEQAVSRNLIARNSGNLVFLGAAQKILSAPGVDLEADGLRVQPSAAEEINERFDAYVIPLANAFRPNYEARLIQATQLLRRLTIPVSILGVGADGTIDGDMARIEPMAGVVRDFVAAALDRGPSIGVRGELTADYLRRLGFRDVEVIGCPSMFLDGPRLDVAKRTERLTREHRVVITISPYLKAMGPILQHHVARYPNLAYVAQDLSSLEMLVLGTSIDGARPEEAIPRHPDHPLVRDGTTRQYIDPWPWIADLRGADFVFGSRIHGTIASLLAGTPAYLLAHDARTVELARYFDIPHQALRDTPPHVDAADLYDVADLGPLLDGHATRFDRFARYLAEHNLEHAFDHPGSAEAFDRRVAATAYPPAVTRATSATAHRRRDVRALETRVRAWVRRGLKRDGVRRLRAGMARFLGRVRDTGGMEPAKPVKPVKPANPVMPAPAVQRATRTESAPAVADRRLLLMAGVDDLAEVRSFVRASVAELGGSTRVAEDLVQATDEATCNVILHGYAGKPGEIELAAALHDGSIEITIADRAPAFDPTSPIDPDVNRPRPRGTAGVGLQLARTMTDEVRHHVRPDGGNELTLVRSIDDPAKEG